MLISILGPDGTGKTTLATSIAKNNAQLTYVYFGYNKESRSYAYFEKFIKSEIRNPILKIIRKALVYFNDLHYCNTSKKNHLISDRFPIDSYISTFIHKKWTRHYYFILSKIFPKPDLVILLVGDAETIYLRKKESTPPLIERSIELYKQYLEKNHIPHILIDTTTHDISASYELANDFLKKNL